jgi:hypothetical protein
MGLLVNDIIAKFPLKNIPGSTGEPDDETINNMFQKLYGNAASLPTTIGGGAHDHISLLMTAALYATLLAIPYNAPQDPCPTPNHPNNATAAPREQICMQHKEDRCIFDNKTNMDDAIKAQIIDSINNTYPCELRNKDTGYMGISSRTLTTFSIGTVK